MKIYKFQYQNIVAFYTLNIRNINYAGYTNSGQYILVVKEDRLYFVNPFSLNT